MCVFVCVHAQSLRPGARKHMRAFQLASRRKYSQMSKAEV